MSWLMRTGTGRNNVSYGGGSTTKGQYLKRTANGRNNISYVSISSNGTHNLLERYNTTKNGIRWNNLSFSFFTQYESTYKSSTTVTIPSGCTKIDIFCVGDGGGGGYTKTLSNVSVSSGQSISIIIGTGGKWCYDGNPAGSYSEFDATASSVSRSGTVLCSANGANFDTSKVTNMNNMFTGCTSLTTIICTEETEQWIRDNATNMKIPNIDNITFNRPQVSQ